MPKSPFHTTRECGQWAEQEAAAWLVAQGLRELSRNYRCPCGEIDLVMRHGQTLVFTEVRYRSNRFYGEASETIDARKRMRILKTAQYFLITHPSLASLPCRFDVISIHGAPQAQHIEWIQGAFEA